MKIYFEKIRPYYYPIIRYFVLRGYKISMFNFDINARKIKWLRLLLDSGRISKISHVIIGSDKFILANIEKASDLFLKDSRMANSMARLYGHDDLLWAYKKYLAKQLSDFYSMQIVLEREKLSDNQGILLFPKRYLDTLRLLKLSGAKIFKLPGVKVPLLFRLINGLENLFFRITGWLRICFVNLCAFFIIASKVVIGYRKKNIPSYKYAIPITNPQFQFKFNEYRRFDFLLDNRKITKNDTVFLFFVPADKVLTKKLLGDGYHIFDCSNRNIFFNHRLSLCKRRGRLLGAALSYAFGNLFSSFREETGILSASFDLIYSFLQWTVILDNLSFSHYIVLNEEGLRHIGRNILLRNLGAQSWCYTYSAAYGYSHTGKDIPADEMLHWLWFFIIYDHFVAWNSQIIEFHRQHPQRIGEYHNVGCIWSEFVILGQKKMELSDFLTKYKVEPRELRSNYKVVSFFDTSYFESVFSKYPLQDGIKFYSDIKRLLDEEKGLFVIIKEKKPRAVYTDIKYFVYSPDHKLFFDLINILAKHPRCYVSGHSGDPTDIIKVSDLTVSYAFSSTAVEALGARKKAIFYDPVERFRGYYYDQIPGLVGHGYLELKTLVNKLLYETNDAEYEAYLNSQIFGKVDDYLDGNGLTRFRDLLSEAAKAND